MNISASTSRSIGPIVSPSVHAEADLIVLGASRDTMRIEWADGSSSSISARALRAACRCAWCTKSVRAGNEASIATDLRFISIALHGPETLHPVFSDGHRTGLFPFIYVHGLAHGAKETLS